MIDTDAASFQLPPARIYSVRKVWWKYSVQISVQNQVYASWLWLCLIFGMLALRWRHNEQQINSLTIVYLTVYSGADQTKH